MASVAATDLTLTIKSELCAYKHTSRHDCWAVTTIKAPLFEPESRVPIDVVAVIDVSSSMGGTKLDLVKKTLLFVISQLKECDRLSLVTYDSNVYVKFGLIKMTVANKSMATSTVEGIRAGSSTNLCGGLLKGMEEIAYSSGADKAKVQSVLLFTDGQANRGIKTKDGILAEMMRIQNPQGEKVDKKKFDGTVYTFGFGTDHDANMLAAISTQGGGVYYFIDTNEKIPESFADCLGGLLSVVGQNLSLKMEIQGDNQLNEVHSSRAVNWTVPNKSCEISLGDIQSEETRDIVISVVLPALDVSGTEAVLKATLSYFNVITTSMQTISCDMIVNRTDADPGAPDVNVDQQRNRIIAASALKQAKALADQGNLEGARTLLNETIAEIEKSVSSKSDFSRALLVDLRRSLASSQSHSEYRSRGQKFMSSKEQVHNSQRSNFVDEQSYYRSPLKLALRVASSSKPALLSTSPRVDAVIQLQASTSSDVPNSSKSSDVPDATKSSDVPNDSKSPDVPNDSKSPDVPNDSKSSDVPNDSKSPDVPNDSKSSDVPNDSKSSDVPNDSKSSDVQPDASKSPDVPNDSKSSDVPNDSKSSDVPNDSKSSDVQPDASKSPDVPNDSKSSDVPNDSKSSDVPDASKSSDVQPDDSKSPDVPNDSKSSDVQPDASKSPDVPNDSKSSDVPNDSKSSVVPDASMAPTPNQSSTPESKVDNQ